MLFAEKPSNKSCGQATFASASVEQFDLTPICIE